MDAKFSILFALCWYGVSGSGVNDLSAPIVAATSSQYFARTFNRLVEAPALVSSAVAPPFVSPVVTHHVPQAFAAQEVSPVFQPIVVTPLEPTVASVTPQVAKPMASLPPTQPTLPTAPKTPNVATSITTAQAFAQSLLRSAPVPVPLDIITPQFQFLPLEDNGAVNSMNLPESIHTMNTISSNNFESSFQSEMKTSSRKEQNSQFSNILQNNGFYNQNRIHSNQQNTHNQNEKLYKQQMLLRIQEIARQQQLAQEQHQQNSIRTQLQQQEQLVKQQQFYKEQLYKHQELVRYQEKIRQEQFIIQKQLARQEWIRQQLKKQQQVRSHRIGNTTVEIIKVPLTYISSPPLRLTQINQFHTFVPTPANNVTIPCRNRLAPFRTQGRLTAYSPINLGVNNARIPARPRLRDVEPTTFRVPRFNAVTSPPRR